MKYGFCPNCQRFDSLEQHRCPPHYRVTNLDGRQAIDVWADEPEQAVQRWAELYLHAFPRAEEAVIVFGPANEELWVVSTEQSCQVERKSA